MKILLVEPSDKLVPTLSLNGAIRCEPIELEQIAGAVPEHETLIVDLRLDKRPLDYFLSTFRPNIVGVTGFTASHSEIQSIVSKAKEYDALTVGGGPHISFCFKEINDLDFAVIGEGELAFAKLVEVIREGCRDNLQSIPNIAWNFLGNWIVNEPNSEYLWPLPRRCMAGDYKYAWFHYPVATVEATRGCPRRCNFCLVPKIMRGKFRKRPAGEFVSYLKNRDERFVFLPDPDMFADVQYATSLANILINQRVDKSYAAAARVDDICAHPELFSLWKKAGMLIILLGLEGYSQDQLDDYKKGTDIRQNEVACDTLDKLGMVVIGSVIVDPQWGREAFQSCQEYINDLKIDIPFLPVLTPFPGTDIFMEKSIIKDYRSFDVTHPVTKTYLPEGEFQKEISKLYQKVYPFKRVWRLITKLAKSKLCKPWKPWEFIRLVVEMIKVKNFAKTVGGQT
jgi:radical SAM superfamily enzyme YgiQ (UPF0313 family)